MIAVSAKPLRENRNFIEGALLVFKLGYHEMVGRHGEPHREMDENDDEAGPCVYWDFEFDDEISVHIVYHLAYEFAEVFSDVPEIERLICCLGLQAREVDWRRDVAEPEEFETEFGPKQWVLERQDDHGIVSAVARCMSEKEANALRVQLEKGAHKQFYFVEKIR